MARIREYTQQTSVSGEVGGRRATAEDFGYGREMQEFGNTVQSVGAYIKQEQDRKEVEDASVKMSEARQQWTETYLKRQETAAPGDMTMAPTMKQEMDSYFGTMAEGYSSSAAKKYIKMHGTGMTTDFFARGLQYQQAQAGIKAKADYQVRVKTDSDITYLDPSQYDAVKGRLLADIQSGIGPLSRLQNDPTRAKLEQDAVSDIAWTAGQGWLKNGVNRNYTMSQVQGAQSVVPEARFDTMVTGILQREGNKYLPQDNKNGESKFGITKRSHPNEDIANMTASRAAEIYKRDYFDAHRIGDLPPAVGAVVLDGVVNHGSAFKNQLVNAARNGASVDDLLQMRKTEYERLAKSKPEVYGDDLKGWMNRLDAVRKEALQVESQAKVPLSIDESKLPAWYGDMSSAGKDRFLREAVTQVQQDRSVERSSLEQTQKDAMATLSVGKEPAYIPPTRFAAAYGPGGQAKYEEYEAIRSIAPWAANLHGQSDNQIALSLKAERDVVGGAGAAADVARLKVKEELAKDVAQMRKNSPAEYVVQNMSYAGEAYRGMASVLSDPKATEMKKTMATAAYVQAVSTEQTRLGMPVQVMTAEMKAGMLDRYKKAAGQDVAVFMRNEAAVWGSNWPQVIQEMGKSLPPSALVLGQAPSIAEDAQAALAESNRMTADERKAGIDTQAITQMNTQIARHMGDFGMSLTVQEGGQQTYAAWASEAEKLAIYYHRGGLPPNQAAEKVYQKLVTDVWEVKSTYRVPKQVTSSVPMRDIEYGANAILRNPSNLPFAIRPTPPGMRDEDFKRIETAKISKDLFWANMQGDKGLVMYRKVAPGEYMRVPSESGGNIEFTWNELATRGKTALSTAGRAPIGKGSMLAPNAPTGFE